MIQSTPPRLYLFFCLLLFAFNSYTQSSEKQLNDLFEQSKSLYQNRQFYESLNLLDSIDLLFEQTDDEQQREKLIFSIAHFFIKMNDRTLSMKYLYKGVENFEMPVMNYDSSRYFYLYDKNAVPIYVGFESQETRNRAASLYCNFYNRLGGGFYNDNEYEKAKEYWNIMLQTASVNGELWYKSIALNNLADVFNIQKNKAKAAHFYRGSFELTKQIRDTRGVAYIAVNLAGYFMDIDLLDSTNYYLNLADSLLGDLEYNKDHKNLHHYKGVYYQRMGQFDLSVLHLKQSLEIAIKLDDVNEILSTFKELGNTFEQAGRLDSAIVYVRLWNNLYQELVFRKDKKTEFEADAKYQLRHKQSVIDNIQKAAIIKSLEAQQSRRIYFSIFFVLIIFLIFVLIINRERRLNNQKLELQYEEIKQQNHEKELLLKEIHHRVKNNLQIITSLLSLQSGIGNDDMLSENFSYVQNRVQSMALIHEMLYQSNDFSAINYGEYLQKLINGLLVSYKGKKHAIELSIDANNIFLDIDTAVPLGLIINEIVTNTMKYAFKADQGKIYVDIKERDTKQFELKIGDNGAGIPKDFDIKKSKSLGMRLVNNLVRQLGGKLNMDLSRQGTHYNFNFVGAE